MSLIDHVNRNYLVTLYERHDKTNQVVALLGTTPPTPSAGGGGYQAITLPQRAAVTRWQGRDSPLVLTLPLRLVEGQSQPWDPKARHGAPKEGKTILGTSISGEQPISEMTNRLIKMWRPARPDKPPPVLRLKAHRSLVPFSNLPFVMNDLQWGAAQADHSGTRFIQDIVVVLMEYRADESLQTTSTKKPAQHQTVYTVKKGDTLRSIAKRYGITWKQLAAAQSPPITDPRRLKVGAKLSIPAHHHRS